MLAKVGILLFAACGAHLPGVVAAPTDNGLMTTRAGNLLVPVLYCGAKTDECEQLPYSYRCSAKRVVEYDKENPDCHKCHCSMRPPTRGEELSRSVPEPRQVIDAPASPIKKPRNEKMLVEVRNDEAIEVRNEESVQVRDEDYLKLHVWCGTAALTDLCTSDTYGYYCTVAGLDRSSNRLNLSCQNNCQCLTDKNTPYTPAFVPFSPWAPISEVNGEEKNDPSG